ncbi:MAG: DUF5677 domain-containing protein, partial [Moraxellaceae bacterium]|nr:DUF5677 domain-containing protein [Moraxellaceae bacterium]
TDVRWVSLLYPIALGRMRMPGDILEGIAKYPNHGDQRSVRPSIRAMEMSVTAMSPDGGPAWNEEFWKECLDKTHCTPVLPPSEDEERHDRKDLFKAISEMHAALVEHWFSTLTTTGVDAKHDGSYGFAFYALSLITEMCVSLNFSSISGRLLLRTLAECRITLAYLAAENDAALWEKYRSYGSGQAKLALLKLEKLGKDVPSHISESVLETLSNEDYFQEYLNIELGSWSGKDLRKMSESCETKDIYDSYFGWTSNFVHGHWGAQRDCCMAHCLNPLHRLHRVPLPGHRILENALPDGVELVNGILDSLSTLYPGFSDRLSIKPADDDAPE